MNDVAILGVMIPIIGIIGAVIMVIYLRRYENTERMSMIERGVDPSLFTRKKVRNSSLPLRFGLLMIGAGLGFLIGYFLDRAYYMEEVGYFSMLFIFGGLGLIGSYVIEEKKNKDQD
jgi:hypothetical protein